MVAEMPALVTAATLAWLMLARLFSEQASAILDVLALATIAGSMLVYSRVKAALLVSDTAAKSWQAEADAQKERAERAEETAKKATLTQTELIAKVAALEQRPDLARLEVLVAEGTSAMKAHELQAGLRTERLIAVLERNLALSPSKLGEAP